MNRFLMASVLAALLAACPSSGGDGADTGSVHKKDGGAAGADADDVIINPHTLTAILIEPTNLILEVDLNAPAQQVYKATGLFSDGANEDVTSLATWTTSNPAVGTLSGATLQIPAKTAVGAEVTRINASYGGKEGLAQLTVVAYRKTGAKTDFFFVLPYQDAAGAQKRPLDFKTDVRSLDVFFAADTTASMYPEIANLQSTLNGTIVPGIQQQIPDTQFGAGSMEDFPIDPYGATRGTMCTNGGSSEPDQPFRLFQSITASVADVQAGVNKLSIGGKPIGCGWDTPEGQMEALYQIATGDGLTGPSPTSVPANHTGVGGVGFRKGSMPVVVPITDAAFHTLGEGTTCPEVDEYGDPVATPTDYSGSVGAVAHSRQATKAALAAICAKVVGVAAMPDGNICPPDGDEIDFAKATGARIPPEAWTGADRPASCAAGQCCTGLNGAGRAPDGDGLCPLVFLIQTNGTGLGSTIVSGLKMLTRYAAFTVTTAKSGGTTGDGGVALPAGKTTADFITAITPDTFTKPAPPPTLPDPTKDATSFKNVTPGTVVSFQVSALNTFQPETSEAQIFHATIKVLADGCTDLDQREVIIVVPPASVIPPT